MISTCCVTQVSGVSPFLASEAAVDVEEYHGGSI